MQNCLITNCFVYIVDDFGTRELRGGGVYMAGGILRDSTVANNGVYGGDTKRTAEVFGGGIYLMPSGSIQR